MLLFSEKTERRSRIVFSLAAKAKEEGGLLPRHPRDRQLQAPLAGFIAVTSHVVHLIQQPDQGQSLSWCDGSAHFRVQLVQHLDKTHCRIHAKHLVYRLRQPVAHCSSKRGGPGSRTAKPPAKQVVDS
jgi:hypothetical protein